MLWNKHKWKIIAPVLILAVLAGVFYYGGNAPGARGWSAAGTPAPSGSPPAVTQTPPAEPKELVSAPEETAQATQSPEETPKPESSPEPSTHPETKPPEPSAQVSPETGTDKYLTDPVPEGKPLPVEPQDVKVSTTAYTCTISISCATILDNIELCDPEKVELVPEDGWILKPIVVTFYEGESVFNVLQRVCKQQKIHMEYMNVPIYNSAYIEGIHNLYEFDVGEKSGWMFKVNDWFPNYGCSRYQLKDGDVIVWLYTCDLGYDVGGGYAVGG